MTSRVDYAELFRLCFPLATHPRIHVGGATYDVFTNYVYVPKLPHPSESLYTFFHEYAHAQLNNGVLGMTCLTVFNLLSFFVESVVYDSFHTTLATLAAGPPSHRRLHRALVTGRAEEVDAWTDPILREVFFGTAAGIALHEDWTRTSAQEARSVMAKLAGRCRAIRDQWVSVQEGLATFAQIQWARSTAEDARDMLAQCYSHLFDGDTESADMVHVRKELTEYAEEDHRALMRGVGEHAVVEGYAACVEIALRSGDERVPWAASFAASHFPYAHCDFLDMKDAEFADWLRGSFDFRGRMRHAVDTTDNLLALWGLDDADAAMNCYLNSFPLQQGIRRLPRAGSCFGDWEREYLWNANTMQPILGHRRVAREDGEWSSENKEHNFKHAARFLPPTILSTGEIRSSSPESTIFCKRMFVLKYELERTMRLDGLAERVAALRERA
jgi:hypothetical protein